MGPYFLDTSAAVKRYVTEIGSRWITALVDPAAGNACWLATITQVEALAALYLRVRTGTLTLAQAQQAERLFRRELRTRYRRVFFSSAIRNHAMRLVTIYPLRAYDAVQLASALQVQRQQTAAGSLSLTLLSADRNLNRAAVAEGLLVDDPNQHP
jgi:predicted nucleic acid-binding protein